MNQAEQSHGIVAWVEQGLLGWRRITEALERTLVDNVAATVPWLAPIAPAYMAYRGVTNVLGWDAWVAWTVALAVEGLGLAVTSTAFQLWDWNDKKNLSDQAAPLWVAIAAEAFYLAVIVTVNVLLDGEAGIIERAAKALLSLLSVVAAVTLALRAQHARRLAEKRLLYEERREERRQSKLLKEQAKLAVNQVDLQKLSVKVSGGNGRHAETYGKWSRWPEVPLDEQMKIVRMDVGQVVETYGVDERTAYNWLRYARRDHGVVGEVARFEDEMTGKEGA